jgi:hypothetical protein
MPVSFPSTLRVLTALAATMSMCPAATTMTMAIPLLNGRFETTTDVQDLLNLALDAADMRESTDFTAKQTIYTDGVQRGST